MLIRRNYHTMAIRLIIFIMWISTTLNSCHAFELFLNRFKPISSVILIMHQHFIILQFFFLVGWWCLANHLQNAKKAAQCVPLYEHWFICRTVSSRTRKELGHWNDEHTHTHIGNCGLKINVLAETMTRLMIMIKTKYILLPIFNCPVKMSSAHRTNNSIILFHIFFLGTFLYLVFFTFIILLWVSKNFQETIKTSVFLLLRKWNHATSGFFSNEEKTNKIFRTIEMKVVWWKEKDTVIGGSWYLC